MSLDINEMRLDVESTLFSNLGQIVTIKDLDEATNIELGNYEAGSVLPNDAVFFANLRNSYNAQVGSGNLIGTPFGDIGFSDQKLDLSDNTNKYLLFDGLDNFNEQHTIGTIRFLYTPNYQKWPVSSEWLFSIANSFGSNLNKFSLYHAYDPIGGLNVLVRDKNGQNEAWISSSNWAVNIGQTYELELNYDFEAGDLRVFIDGNIKMQTIGSQNLQLDRDNNINSLAIGAANTSSTPYAKFSEFVYFDSIQHTSSFAPGVYERYTVVNDTNETIVLMAMSEFQQKQEFGDYNPKRLRGYFKYNSVINDKSVIIDSNNNSYIITSLHDLSVKTDIIMKEGIVVLDN